MTISSRTPEGEPNHCPVCGKDLFIEPSLDTRDAPCPHCGHLLWFRRTAHGPVSPHMLAQMAERILQIGTDRLGPPTPAVRESVLLLRDATQLEAVLKRATEVYSWEELFGPG